MGTHKKSTRRFVFKKKEMFWATIIGLGAWVSVIGGLYGIDSLYVRASYHSECMAETKQNLGELQKQITVQRAYDEVFFWQRIEVELTKSLVAHPNDKALKTKLDEVQKNKKEAEDRLKKVQ